MRTTIHRQTLELLTPALLAGAHKQSPEWRGPSLHGQLHFWARLLNHQAGPDEMRRREARLMGGATPKKGKPEHQAGPFAVWLEAQVDFEAKEYPSNPHNYSKGQRRGIPPGSRADLCWSRRSSTSWRPDPSAQADLENDFQRLLRAWVLLGAIGLRANRAAGSVWIPGWSPTPEQFSEQVKLLKLPASVEVHLLPALDLPDEELGLRIKEREHVWACDPGERLRAVATNTIEGKMKGDPLGYVGDQGRKASPLKLKVGRFHEGLRIIAVHDDRDGRGGSLEDAISALEDRRKSLGTLLRKSTAVVARSEVARLFSGVPSFNDFPRYQSQVDRWLSENRLDLVTEFLRATQAPIYRGLREQSWYGRAAAAVDALPA